MFCPLTEALQMKSIPTNSRTGSSSIAFDYLHVTNGAKIIFIFIFLLENNIFSQYFDFGVFEKLLDFVIMNTSICNDVSELFIIVFMPEKKVVVFREIENISQNI